MRIRDLLEDGRIVKGVNTTADVDTNSISREAAKFGNKVDKDGKPPTLSKKVKGKSTNVLYNLGLAEGQLIPNPPNTFLTKSDTAYDHYKIGTNLANLKAVPKGANYDEPDVVIAPYAGKKEMKYLMKQLKRIGYDVQGAAGYQDAHFDDEPTGGEAPPQVKNYGPLGRVKLVQLRTVQKERSYKKLIKQLERVLKDDYAPIQIDRKGRIVNGHHRYDALRLAGAEYARVHMADDVLEDMLDEGWSKKYKDSINCSNPKGFSQKAHCAGRKKNEDIDENFADGKKKGLIKATKEDIASYKKIIGLAKKAHETNELEPYFYDAVKITFNMNLYKKYPKLLSTLLKVGRKVSKDDWPYTVKDIKKNTGIDLEAHIIENFANATKAKAATDVAYNESTDLDSLRKFVRSQREAPDQVLYQMMMAPDTYGHSASNFVRSWYERTKEENGLNDVDSALEIMVDELGLNENSIDDKTKGAIDKYQQTNTVGKTSRAFTDIEEEYLNIRELALKLMKNGLDAYTAYYKASEKMQFDPAMVFDWMGSEFKDEELEDFIPIEYERDWIKRAELGMSENFADGKKPGRKGLAKRKGVNCSQSVTKLRKIAKNSSGEKQRMAHWCANMKSGKSKKK